MAEASKQLAVSSDVFNRDVVAVSSEPKIDPKPPISPRPSSGIVVSRKKVPKSGLLSSSDNWDSNDSKNGGNSTFLTTEMDNPIN